MAAAAIVLAAAAAPARFGAMSLLDVSPVLFRDVAAESGITFTPHQRRQPRRSTSSRRWARAALLFDYDGDGWLDVFLVDGGSLADPTVAAQARHRALSAIAATARSRM